MIRLRLTFCLLTSLASAQVLQGDAIKLTDESLSGNAPLTILNVSALPTSDTGVSGALWNNNGVLNISP